jgi:hypothetical protein
MNGRKFNRREFAGRLGFATTIPVLKLIRSGGLAGAYASAGAGRSTERIASTDLDSSLEKRLATRPAVRRGRAKGLKVTREF